MTAWNVSGSLFVGGEREERSRETIGRDVVDRRLSISYSSVYLRVLVYEYILRHISYGVRVRILFGRCLCGCDRLLKGMV